LGIDLEVVAQSNIRATVLIPAHNEALEIGLTLATLKDEVKDPKQIVVIADNCTDETAQIARSYDVQVIERTDELRRGKGYALDYGLQYLEPDAPDVVIMVDADCEVEAGSLEKLACQAMRDDCPVQAVYLMNPPKNPSERDYISFLAFLVKNLVRPTGLARLGLPCLLTGSGMAFKWDMLRRISLSSGNIVEDMQLGLDLAIAGYSPSLCEDAKVKGRFPQQQNSARSQRQRWEHGHLKTILTQVPRLIGHGITQRRWDLIALALDLAVPPLALLVVMWIGVLVGAVLAGYLGAGWIGTVISLINGGLLLWAVGVSWVMFGQEQVPLSVLLRIPLYILWKIPSYFGFLIQPQKQWVRTERDGKN